MKREVKEGMKKPSSKLTVGLLVAVLSVSLFSLIGGLSASAATEIIVDNPAATFVGSWPTSTYYSGYYGANYQYNTPGTGTDACTWWFTIPTTGQYTVYAWWASASNKASNAPFYVYTGTGTYLVSKDQRSNGGSWQLLGTYTFSAGSCYVRLTDNANAEVVADAIRVVEYVAEVPDCYIAERIYAPWYTIPVSTWTTMVTVTTNIASAGYYKVELDANIYIVNARFGLSIGVDSATGDATTSHYYDADEGGDTSAVLGVHTQETYYLTAGSHTFYFRAGHTNAVGSCQIQNSHITVTFFKAGSV